MMSSRYIHREIDGDESEKVGHFLLNTSLIASRAVEWAFLEQLALAAIDVGRLDVADVSVPYNQHKCAI